MILHVHLANFPPHLMHLSWSKPGYFNYTGFWVTPVEDEPDFEKYAVEGILYLRNAAFSNYRGFKTGPVLTYHFEGKVITTQMDASHYSFDDL